MSRKILGTLLVLILTSCATTANYEKILSTWVGNHADKLVYSWGPPQGAHTLSDGSQVLEYSSQRNARIGGYTTTTPVTTYHSGTTSYGGFSGTSTTYVPTQTPTYNLNIWCKTRFMTDHNGIITRWSWEGNGCKAEAPN